MKQCLVPVLVVAAVIACLWGLSSARASTSAARANRQFTVTRHGLRISLTLHGRNFSRNALVPMPVSLQNISRRAVLLRRSASDNPYVAVIGGHNDPLYPPALPVSTGTAAVAQTPQRLEPGQTLTTSVYVIMRAERLQVRAVLQNGTELYGSTVMTRLRQGKPPQVVLHMGQEVSADFLPRTTVFGPLLFQSVSTCRIPGSGDPQPIEIRSEDWTAATGTRVSPVWPEGCSAERRWTVVAGWQDNPVATLHYSG